MLEKTNNSISQYVSRETYNDLMGYKNLLLKWNHSLNLVGNSTLENFNKRHLLDAIQLKEYIEEKHNRIIDFGSGGGIPVIILCIIFKDKHFFALESDKRKSVFLKHVALKLGLNNIEVICKRINNIKNLKADLCISRACATLSTLLNYTLQHSKNGTEALFLKGENLHAEITLANHYEFKYSIHQSITNDNAHIIKISNICRK